eukprot:Rhum_TRINITY_DN17187_c0_g1::Rhum_TRINITY_DN17187_c0_g1_i1::g.165446::m.165446/K11096/SNRPD2, SMD2; small nuclear ribonucleoprotein D2
MGGPRRQIREATPPPDPEELERKEEEAFNDGPLSLLAKAVKEQSQVLINCRNNKKIIARVKAFDRHMNMVLEGAQEVWTEVPKTGKGVAKKRAANKFRFLSKMFLRGDAVILVVKNRGPNDA